MYTFSKKKKQENEEKWRCRVRNKCGAYLLVINDEVVEIGSYNHANQTTEIVNMKLNNAIKTRSINIREKINTVVTSETKKLEETNLTTLIKVNSLKK
jgi:hypothetical protein